MTDISPYMILDWVHIWPILVIVGIVLVVTIILEGLRSRMGFCGEYNRLSGKDDIDGGDDK